MRKTTIIYLTHWRFPSEKTMTPLIMKTCAGFVAEGYDAELWVPWRYNPEWEGKDPFTVHGIPRSFHIRRIPALDLLRYLGTPGFLLLLLSFNLSAFFFLLGRRRVTLYAHDVRDVLLPCLLGFPTFVEIHDFYESAQRWVNRLVFRRAAGLIVTNTIKVKHIREAYGVPAERMLHQRNAVDYGFFAIPAARAEARKILDLPQGERIALYTGHLFSWKGVDTLALAATHLPEHVRIYFVGGTPEDHAVLEDLVRRERLPRITFVPHEPHEKMPLYMRAADVLVLPNTAREAASKYETSPVKLFEYLSSGTPVVASDLPSIRDIASDNEVRFFAPDDPKSLASAIAETLADSAGAARRSAAGQSLGKASSWEARAAAIATFMRRQEKVDDRTSARV